MFRCVSETAKQLASENPVNVATVLISFVIIMVVIIWIMRKLDF